METQSAFGRGATHNGVCCVVARRRGGCACGLGLYDSLYLAVRPENGTNGILPPAKRQFCNLHIIRWLAISRLSLVRALCKICFTLEHRVRIASLLVPRSPRIDWRAIRRES